MGRSDIKNISGLIIELIEAGFGLFMAFVIRILPLKIALKLGEKLGVASFYLFKKHRNIALDNLRKAFKNEKSEEEIKQITMKLFINLGLNVIEFCRLPELTRENISNYVEYDGLKNLTETQKTGKGIIFLVSHFGNWELLAAAHALHGFSSYAVVRPLDNKYLEKMIKKYRQMSGLGIIEKKNAMREIISHLDKGHMVGILIDQNTSQNEGVFVDFFGRCACTSKVTALIAQRKEVPVLPAFIIRQGNGRHKIIIEKPMDLISTDNPKQDIVTNTQNYTKMIELYIRKYPDHWFWIHKRWKTQPDFRERNSGHA